MGVILNEVFEAVVEPTLVQPTFVLDHPLEISPLAKPHRSKPGCVERWELFIAGTSSWPLLMLIWGTLCCCAVRTELMPDLVRKYGKSGTASPAPLRGMVKSTKEFRHHSPMDPLPVFVEKVPLGINLLPDVLISTLPCGPHVSLT